MPCLGTFLSPKIKAALVYLLKVLLLAVVIHLTARLGLSMAYVQANTSPVWSPAGIALAALLLFGPEMWPGITLRVFLGSLLTQAPLNLSVRYRFSRRKEIHAR
jgi:integral membrane sensor domain MASE1